VISPIIRRSAIYLAVQALVPLLLLLRAGGVPALAAGPGGAEDGAPLPTARVSPQFDWNDLTRTGRRSGSAGGAGRPVLQGTVQRSTVVVPSGHAQIVRSPFPAPPAEAGPGGDYVGTPTKVTLHGIICQSVAASTGDRSLDQFFSASILDKAAEASAGQPQHFHVCKRKLIGKGLDILNYMFDYRAFGPSTEAANVILDEHQRAKSTEARAYYRQRERDEKSLEVASNIMQLAMGLGMPGTARGRSLIDSSLQSLRQLVGEDQANQILAGLQKYGKELSFPPALSNQDLWDMHQRENKIRLMVQSAILSDADLKAVTSGLHRYNSHGKFAQRAVGLVEAGLSIAAFSPSFVAPAAESAYFLLMMATGGPEQDKLLKELYLSKRLDSRLKVINEKAHMAVDTYHMALLSQNPVLLACTESMVRQMSGEETMREVFGGAHLALEPDPSTLSSVALRPGSPAGDHALTAGGNRKPAL